MTEAVMTGGEDRERERGREREGGGERDRERGIGSGEKETETMDHLVSATLETQGNVINCNYCLPLSSSHNISAVYVLYIHLYCLIYMYMCMCVIHTSKHKYKFLFDTGIHLDTAHDQDQGMKLCHQSISVSLEHTTHTPV